MGVYFAAIGLGNKLAGTIGQNSERLGEENNLFRNNFYLFVDRFDSNFYFIKN